MSDRAQYQMDCREGNGYASDLRRKGASACAYHLHCSTLAGMGPGCGMCLTAGTLGSQRNAAGLIVRCRWCEAGDATASDLVGMIRLACAHDPMIWRRAEREAVRLTRLAVRQVRDRAAADQFHATRGASEHEPTVPSRSYGQPGVWTGD